MSACLWSRITEPNIQPGQLSRNMHMGLMFLAAGSFQIRSFRHKDMKLVDLFFRRGDVEVWEERRGAPMFRFCGIFDLQRRSTHSSLRSVRDSR